MGNKKRKEKRDMKKEKWKGKEKSAFTMAASWEVKQWW